MKRCILALDYDGTIAHHGALDPDVRSAIQKLRASGTTMILVTGRIVRDLQRVAGDLRWVDAVVAENGAVLFFPASNRTILLGQPSPELVAELGRQCIDITVGACVIEADATYAPRILAVVRDLELPLTLAFNRGRLMVLPQSISKASGLREALRILRLSAHNALAIGDAENDHALLAECEVGVAVAWGSRPLQAAADVVIPGSGPHAVAGYLQQIATQERLPPRKAAKHSLLLGYGADGQPINLAIWGRNALIVGDSHSGKSLLAGLLAEQLILQRYAVCVVDPEGEYTTLEALPGVLVWNPQPGHSHVYDPIHTLRYPDSSVVINLSALDCDERYAYGTALLRQLAAMRRRTGLPHRIILDEAHYFLHGAESLDLLTPELGGYTLVTYRASALHPSVRATIDIALVTQETDPYELQTLFALQSAGTINADWDATIRDLAVDEAVLLPGVIESGDTPCRFQLAPRLTLHVRHQRKYRDVPIADALAFVFTHHGVPIGQPAHTLDAFATLLASVPEDVIAGHLQRSDFSRWIIDVFGDTHLATQIHHLEQQYRAGSIACARSELVTTIRERYGET